MRIPGRTVAVLAAAVTIGLSGTPAMAATSWTITPGGSFTGLATTFQISDPATHTTITCNSATIGGTLKSGSGIPGAGAGSITSVNFGTCTAQNGAPFDIAAANLPWSINLSSFPVGDEPTGTIKGIQISSLGPLCKAIFQASNGAAAGMAPFGFDDSTDTLTVGTADNLLVSNLSSCTGYFVPGDSIQTSANFVLMPRQSITTTP
jgi:hypothetical protein